ncbi:hypothetical protein [Calothrix sp. NIES-2098]|uniref:hypothetical protein n=1 Tax=Calothrix sp. NIES-2098 TaxID=1954171 RepID=UPI000B6050E0|nr:hypothetical protein NIES2098_32100 [Calothrix sp. NIES-2098]
MRYLRLTITDTLSFWDDYLSGYIFDPENSKTFTNWYRIPDKWLENGTLVPERREQLLEHLYGSNWRLGNEDGSKYVVLKIDEHELSDTETAQRLWVGTQNTCYAVSDDDTIESVNEEVM